MWHSVRENKEFKLMDWLMMVLKKPWSTDGGDGWLWSILSERKWIYGGDGVLVQQLLE